MSGVAYREEPDVSGRGVRRVREAMPVDSGFSGLSLRPGDAGYADRLRIDNGRVSAEPRQLLVPSTLLDVKLAVGMAKRAGCRIAVRGGGHGAAGHCVTAGEIVLDMSSFDWVRPLGDGSRLSIGGGARWSHVYRALEEAGSPYVPVGGACSDVGVVGFLLGGGFSFLSRSYGLGADSLESLTMIDCDGEEVSASETRNADLFWACRGGGGGNFGIVTEATVRLHRPYEDLLSFADVQFEGPAIAAMMELYDSWACSLPAATAAYGRWNAGARGPDGEATGQALLITIVHNGRRAGLDACLKPLRALGCSGIDIRESTLARNQARMGGRTALNGARAYIRSGTMRAGGFTAEVAAVIADHLSRSPSADSFVVWTHSGGRVACTPGAATAFAHRDAAYVLEVKAVWREEEDDEAMIGWAYDFFEALRPHFSGAYVNYLDPLLTDWQRAYYGANYPRLVEVKTRWDPCRLFDFPQAIGALPADGVLP